MQDNPNESIKDKFLTKHNSSSPRNSTNIFNETPEQPIPFHKQITFFRFSYEENVFLPSPVLETQAQTYFHIDLRDKHLNQLRPWRYSSRDNRTEKENNLDNVEIGIIGSLVYLGLVLGSISAGPIFSSYSPKWLIFLYLFTAIKGGISMAFCRVGCGFCQVFCYIYFPVWVDQFGFDKQQTLLLTFLQLGVPVGTMLGYVMEAFYVKRYNKWKYAFYTQIILISFCVIILIITPDKFFSRNYHHSESSPNEIKAEFEEWKELINSNTQSAGNNTGNKRVIKNLHLLNAIYDNKYGRPSLYSMFSMIDDTEEEGSKRYLSVLNEWIRNKKFIFTMLGISCLWFVVTGIQFWISDYMQEVMEIPASKVYIIYSVVCITGPVIGVLWGGIFIQYWGGYTDKRAWDACFKIAILAAASGILLPLINWVWLFVILMWLLLFFGGSMTPGWTGIMWSSIPENNKEIGNSVTQLCYNLIGYLPSPFWYGLVCKYTGGSKSRYGLTFILCFAVMGVIMLFFARRAQKWGDEGSEVVEKINNDTIEEKSTILTTLFGRLSLK